MFFEILIIILSYPNLKLGLQDIAGFVAGAEWIWIILFILPIIVVIAIIKSRSKKIRKTTGKRFQEYKKKDVAPTQDDTQFWVCPNCGNNTEMKDGRQYCFSCKIYLSI